MTDAVLFSLYNNFNRGEIYLNDIILNYPDCDIYVGINPQGDTDISKLPHASNIFYGINKPENVVSSDVTGYQKCLDMIRQTDKQYNLVYFLHSKGASYNLQNFNICKKDYFDHFINRKAAIQEKLKDDLIGLWCPYGRFNRLHKYLPEYFDLTKYILPKQFPYDRIGVETLLTFFATKHSLLKRFFADLNSDDLFTKNLETELGHNRYFFEHVFTTFAERYGYFTYIEKFWEETGHLGCVPYSIEHHNELICIWNKNKYGYNKYHG